jgi:membrane protease YdiL (CAAX protease family)
MLRPALTTWISLLRKVTVDQWLAIDAQYRTETLPDARPAAVLVTAALALVLPRFFGQERALEDYPLIAGLFEGLPYPSLHPHVWWALFKLFNYGLLPLLCIKLVLKRPLSDFGVVWVENRRVVAMYAGMLLIVAPFVYWASTTHAFLRTYPKYDGAGESVPQLLVWELAYALQFLMLEFFFRGFLIFSLARYIGGLAVFVMVVPYAMIHLGKPLAECLGSIIAGAALGTIALRTGSIWGGVAVHCAVAWSMDLLALARTGKLQHLF